MGSVGRRKDGGDSVKGEIGIGFVFGKLKRIESAG